MPTSEADGDASPVFVKQKILAEQAAPAKSSVSSKEPSELEAAATTPPQEAVVEEEQTAVEAAVAEDKMDEQEDNNSCHSESGPATPESEGEDTADQLRKLKREVKRLGETLKVQVSSLKQAPQKSFQNGATPFLIGSTVCRSTLCRCSFGGVYLSVPLEDMDAFLASEAAAKENGLELNRELNTALKKDWLNTLGLGCIEVDCRWTGEGRRNLQIPNGEKSYHLAALSSEGVVFARAALLVENTWLPSVVEFRPFNRMALSPWTYEMPEGESVTACECSAYSTTEGLVCVTTNAGLLRVYGLCGTLLHFECVSHVVSLAARDNTLAILTQTRTATHKESSSNKERSALTTTGKLVAVNLQVTESTQSRNGYVVKCMQIDTRSKTPVHSIRVSPELSIDGSVQWFGLTEDVMKTPLVMSDAGAVFALSQASAAPATPDAELSWLCVVSYMKGRKGKYLVHAGYSDHLEVVPHSDFFICKPLTVLPFQVPLALPPSMMSLKAKYPLEFDNVTTYNTLTEEERQQKGFNPLSRHFFDEQILRRRMLIALPALSLTPAASAAESLLELTVEAKTASEVACVQGALLALQSDSLPAFACYVYAMEHEAALRMVERNLSVLPTANPSFKQLFNQRVAALKSVVAPPPVPTKAARLAVPQPEHPVRSSMPTLEVPRATENTLPKPGVRASADLGSLISGSIELRANYKRRRGET